MCMDKGMAQGCGGSELALDGGLGKVAEVPSDQQGRRQYCSGDKHAGDCPHYSLDLGFWRC